MDGRIRPAPWRLLQNFLRVRQGRYAAQASILLDKCSPPRNETDLVRRLGPKPTSGQEAENRSGDDPAGALQ